MICKTLEIVGEICQSVDAIFQLLFSELQQATTASEQNCRDVADRLTQEVVRICSESKRIQASGEADAWATALARHRLQQCLTYYQLGSRRGRVELHSNLSAVVYRYINPIQSQSSYQARLTLIEDFLQGFYVESLMAFRREAHLGQMYTPKSLLDLAEYMAFAERYGKRRIPLPGHRNQQLIILRAQTFSQQQPAETLVDMERAAEGTLSDSDTPWNVASIQQVREQMVAHEPEPEDTLRQTVIKELTDYLEERKQNDCVDYFTLRLRDLPANEIEQILGLTPRQRDYLQQRFKYHLIRFAFSSNWELVHQWLEADLERNLGLSSRQWQTLQEKISVQQIELLKLKQERATDATITQALGCTLNQVQKQWYKILETAWEIRNDQDSGGSQTPDE